MPAPRKRATPTTVPNPGPHLPNSGSDAPNTAQAGSAATQTASIVFRGRQLLVKAPRIEQALIWQDIGTTAPQLERDIQTAKTALEAAGARVDAATTEPERIAAERARANATDDLNALTNEFAEAFSDLMAAFKSVLVVRADQTWLRRQFLEYELTMAEAWPGIITAALDKLNGTSTSNGPAVKPSRARLR